VSLESIKTVAVLGAGDDGERAIAHVCLLGRDTT